MSPTRYRFVALHGFLGAPSDWEVLQPVFPDAAWHTVDLWDVMSDSRASDWESVGRLLRLRLKEAVAGAPGPSILMAYSFGSRLALSVPDLGSAESPFAGVVLVSCNPGFPEHDEAERAVRTVSDGEWARRFIEEPVPRIWAAWDAQPVLRASATPPRTDRLPAPRATLARAMRVASLASQPDYRSRLRAWCRPLLWVTGSRDAKYTAIAGGLAREGVPARFAVCEDSGHRVPWDSPVAFARHVRAWLDDACQPDVGSGQARGDA